ncbi:MAG: YlmH/Sll1252 family protein [Clostridia bacterium]|nr:YlmH/Sll1252 family protein [Clostridia bacterium]
MNDETINLKDLEEKVNKKNKYLTDFLTPLDVKKICEYFTTDKNISHASYEACDISLERTKVYLTKEDIFYDTIDYSNLELTFNISIIRIEPNKFARKLSHKDYLGTLLGLGIKREKVGDIIVCNDNSAYVFISSDIEEYILSELRKVSRETIKVSVVKSIDKKLIVDDHKERDITITSYRMDNLISHAFGIARSISQGLIDKELVKVNYETNTNYLYEIKENDLISVRGYGRIKIVMLDGENKKGRKRVKVYIYTKDKNR